MKSPKTVILLNAPPRSGKDSLAHYLGRYGEFRKYEFKSRLIQIALAVSGLPHEKWDALYEKKNEGSPLLCGMSPREYLITIAERCIKPIFGSTYFIRKLAYDIAWDESDAIPVVSDSGFDDEIPVFSEMFRSVHFLQWQRNGNTFEDYGDSRQFLNPESLPNNVIIHQIPHNDESLHTFLRRTETIIKTIL